MLSFFFKECYRLINDCDIFYDLWTLLLVPGVTETWYYSGRRLWIFAVHFLFNEYYRMSKWLWFLLWVLCSQHSSLTIDDYTVCALWLPNATVTSPLDTIPTTLKHRNPLRHCHGCIVSAIAWVHCDYLMQPCRCAQLKKTQEQHWCNVKGALWLPNAPVSMRPTKRTHAPHWCLVTGPLWVQLHECIVTT